MILVLPAASERPLIIKTHGHYLLIAALLLRQHRLARLACRARARTGELNRRGASDNLTPGLALKPAFKSFGGFKYKACNFPEEHPGN